VFRPHSQEQLPSEPVFQDVQTRDIVRRYIRARYRLLPYLYTTAWQNSQSGMPLTRPLAFEGDDPSLFEDQSAFLWGDNMLIAPVTEKGAKTKLVKFPAGSWFDFWSGARYQGGRSLSVPTSLDNIPVFVRAGAFVPMIGDIMTTRDYRTDQLSVHYYHDAAIISSKGLMYDDDGKSTDPQGLGRYEVLRFQSAFGKSGLAIDFARDRNAEYEGQPTERQIELVIHNWSSLPRQVVIGNKRLLTQKAVNGAAGREGFSYSLADRILKVRFAWKGDNVAINLR
jgi:oligosaccharide 4-alpha-D-glucosyltransferase